VPYQGLLFPPSLIRRHQGSSALCLRRRRLERPLERRLAPCLAQCPAGNPARQGRKRVEHEGRSEHSSGHGGSVFISYAAEDRELTTRIAAYLTSHGWTVWWDRHIPLGMAFDEVIDQALRDADCAVVLWTKASVASRWVRAEASVAARRDILIPVLAEDVEIPLEFRLLQALDLRGTTLRNDDSALDALQQSVARICDGKFAQPPTEDLKNVSKAVHAPRHRPSVEHLVLAALAVSIALGVLWYWDAYHRTIADYYAHVTTRWGLPDGVGPLTSDMVARRSGSIVLVRKGRRHPAHEVRLVDSSGHVPPVGLAVVGAAMADLNPVPSRRTELDDAMSSDLLQLARVTFTHDGDGNVLEQAGFTRGGRRLYTIHFAAPNLGEYKAEGFGMPVRESGIRYLRSTRITEGPHAGRTERVEYLDDQRQGAANENGECGYRLVLSDSGLSGEIVYLGCDGADHPNGVGALKEVLSRDAVGNVVESRTVNESGAPVASRMGIAIVRVRYDRVGNQIEAALFNEKGQPSVVASLGAAAYTVTYDASGRITGLSLQGPDQKPIVNASGFAAQTLEWKSARQALVRFHGVDGGLTRGIEGAPQALITWDTRGYAVESTLLDHKGNPTRGKNGCAANRLRYDDVGNLSEIECLNERGAPTLSSDGLTHAKFTSDHRGNRLTAAFYNLSGEPGRVGETYAVIQDTYNAAGSLVRETYLSAKGNPIKTREGFAAATFEYDAQGNRTLTEFLDEKGQRTNRIDGYSAVRSTFDERRLETATTYVDSGDRIVPGPEGCGTIRYEYEQRGFIEYLACLGADGKPTRGIDGYASARIAWTHAGQVLLRTHFDERDRPTVATRLGYAMRRWTYGSGRLAERSDYDVAGRLTTNAYGYSIVTYQYDDDGVEVSRTLLDTQRRPLDFKVGVDRTQPGSVAADAGFLAGDVILTYDGQVVSTSFQFTNELEMHGSDRTRELRVERAGRVLSLNVPPGRLAGLELAERAGTPTPAGATR
jgi:YD repeat-containing protein